MSEHPEPTSPTEAPPAPRSRLRCCCGALAVLIGLGIAGAFGAVHWIQLGLRACAPYDEALHALGEDPAAREALGDAVEVGWPVMGQLTTTSSGRSGSARLAIPVSGSRGRGALLVSADVTDTPPPGGRSLLPEPRWTFQPLQLRLEDGRTLELPAPPDRISGSVGDSPGYARIVRLVRRDARVRERLGEPLDLGLLGGGYSGGGSVESVTLDGELLGPNGRARLRAAASARDGEWTVDLAEVTLPVREELEGFPGAPPRWRYEGEGVERLILVGDPGAPGSAPRD